MRRSDPDAPRLVRSAATRWRSQMLRTYGELMKRCPCDYAAMQWRIHREAWARKP